jgi:hypothetical protein
MSEHYEKEKKRLEGVIEKFSEPKLRVNVKISVIRQYDLVENLCGELDAAVAADGFGDAEIEIVGMETII